MKLKLIKALIVPLIFSLYSSRVNSTIGKAEPPSAFSLLYQVNDSIQKKYTKALNLFANGKYAESLSEALYVVDNSKNISDKVYATKLIGDIYENINSHQRAISYYKKVLKLVSDINFVSETNNNDLLNIRAKSLLKLGGIYQLIPKADSAKYYLDKILVINSLNKDIRLRKADAHTNLSTIYYYDSGPLRDLEKAKYHANKAIEIHKELNEYQTLAADYGNLASVYMEEGDLEEAKRLYKKALGFIKDDNRLKAVKYREALYDNLGWTLYNLKDYVAYNYLDKSVAIRDSLVGVEISKSIAEIEIINNNEKELMIVENDKKLAQRNTWLVAGIGIGAVLLLLYLINYYKLRQRNLSLKLYENELQQQKNIEKLKTESQTKILNATLNGKEAERKQIAETLHDNISALLSSANLHLQATQKQFNGSVPSEVEKTQEIILEASKQIRDLSHNLVSSVLLKFGLKYALNDVADKYSNSEITFDTQLENLGRYDQDFEIKVYNIIQEFTNNILKYSKANRALIRLKESDKKLFLTIEDNGVGFNAEEEINNGGIGLNQIKARVKMMNGTFNIKSEKDQGTTIKVVVPLVERAQINYV